MDDFNFSGDQIQALKDLAVDVRDGQLPAGTAIAIVSAAYPKIPPQLLNGIFGHLEVAQPTPTGSGSDTVASLPGTPGAEPPPQINSPIPPPQ